MVGCWSLVVVCWLLVVVVVVVVGGGGGGCCRCDLVLSKVMSTLSLVYV